MQVLMAQPHVLSEQLNIITAFVVHLRSRHSSIWHLLANAVDTFAVLTTPNRYPK